MTNNDDKPPKTLLVNLLAEASANGLMRAYDSTFCPFYFKEILELENCRERSCYWEKDILKGDEARLQHLIEAHGLNQLTRTQVAWVLGIKWQRLLRRTDFLQPVETEPKWIWSVEDLANFFKGSSWIREIREAEDQRWLKIEPEAAARIKQWNDEKPAVGIASIEELKQFSTAEDMYSHFKDKARAVLCTIFDEGSHPFDYIDQSEITNLTYEQIQKLDLIETTPGNFFSIQYKAGRMWDSHFKETWVELYAFLRGKYPPAPKAEPEVTPAPRESDLTEPDDKAFHIYSNNYMGAITGNPHTGKSGFLPNHFKNYYKQPLKSLTWIIADPDTSNEELLVLILEKIGTPKEELYPCKSESIADSIFERRRQVWRRVKQLEKPQDGFEFVVCCDNAEYLKTNALQELRSLNAKCGAAVFLVGSHELWGNIKRCGMEPYFFHIDLDE